MDDFDELAAKFLAAEKTAHIRPRWQSEQHKDYAEAKMRITATGSTVLQGIVALTAHRVRLPAKYGFALLFRGKRILGLDVNPGRSHRNLLRNAVTVTHWQRWPNLAAESDPRDQNFDQWFRDFMRAANIVFTFRVLSPPRGVQEKLRLIVNEDFDRRNSKNNGN